ncbi:MAG: 30S ribosomal protein S9 [Candidatus Jorgensenbacteria bacterium]
MPPKTIKTKKPAKTVKVPGAKTERYFEAVGRRKTAVARVRIFPAVKSGKNDISVNGKELEKYFPMKKEQGVIVSPFEKLTLVGIKTTAKVGGGGLPSQAEAIRLGISRALILFDSSLRPRLKAFGYLTRDPRMVERKKPGLRKARRPQQWRKR